MKRKLPYVPKKPFAFLPLDEGAEPYIRMARRYDFNVSELKDAEGTPFLAITSSQSIEGTNTKTFPPQGIAVQRAVEAMIQEQWGDNDEWPSTSRLHNTSTPVRKSNGSRSRVKGRTRNRGRPTHPRA